MSAPPTSLRRLARLVAMAGLAFAAAGCRSPAEKAAAPILEKNAEARGGLDAWREVKTMSWSGKLDAGLRRDPVKQAMAYRQPRNGQMARAQARKALAQQAKVIEAESQIQLPFTMELARPRKSRLEIVFRGQTAVQVFDGSRGWKLRPFLGRHEVEPFTPDELRTAAQQAELDGPLLDFRSKGEKVELEGTETVEGRETFKLKVTSGKDQVRRVWVDKETFLDVRVDGTRKMDGKQRPVWTYFRDYRKVNGLMIPHLLETTVEGIPGSEKIVIERVVVNPDLGNDRFQKPS